VELGDDVTMFGKLLMSTKVLRNKFYTFELCECVFSFFRGIRRQPGRVRTQIDEIPKVFAKPYRFSLFISGKTQRVLVDDCDARSLEEIMVRV